MEFDAQSGTLSRNSMRASRIFVIVAVLALVVLGASRLRFDAEILNVLPSGLESVEGLKLFQNYFPSGQELIVTVESESAETANNTAEQIATLLSKETNRLASAMWRAPWQEHPGQAAELMAYLWLNQHPTNFAIISERLSETSAKKTFQTVKEQLATSFSPAEIGMRAYDPLSLMELPSSVREASGMNGSEDFFASVDGKFRIVTVKPKDGTGNYRQTQAWFQSIKDIIQQGLHSPEFRGVHIHYTGRPAFVSEISAGMEKDMIGTSGGTLLVIGLLFYLTHRRIVPLLWLLFLLLVMLAVTTALGGLALGVVNVMSIGFASILVGLGEDFAIVLYQDAESHPGRSVAEIRRDAAPGILWSALTAAGAFAALNFSSIPGLAQLGTFVAIGLFVAAGVMLVAYLPPLAWLRKRMKAESTRHPSGFLLFETNRLPKASVLWGISAIVALGALALPFISAPQFDRSPDPLRPRRSEAYDAMALVKEKLGRGGDPLWVIVRGTNEAQVSTRLSLVKAHFAAQKDLGAFTVPDSLWPNPVNQESNLATLREIVKREPAIEALAREQGFTTNAMALTREIMTTWRSALTTTNVFKPTGDLSRWVLDKIAASSDAELYCLALVYPNDRTSQKHLLETWPKEFRSNGIVLSGWQLVGNSVFDLALRELPRVTLPIILLVLLCLWLAFRDLREVALSVVLLVFSALTLNCIMEILGWKWNLLNMMAIPMLLGMGVDFSIHMQLALRKSQDLLQVRRSVGKALLLAGATTVAGFGSLAFSSNAGMASLGKTCALGIMIALLTAVYLLPIWWEKFARRQQQSKS